MGHTQYGRYRLLVDLTSYHREFVAGVEGELSNGKDDCYGCLTLDSGAQLQVLWKSIEAVKRHYRTIIGGEWHEEVNGKLRKCV